MTRCGPVTCNNLIDFRAIEKIRQKLTIPMQLGGGLRTMENLAKYFDMGIDRLILGTTVLKDRSLTEQALERFPGRIAIALDARDGKLATEGWVETSTSDALDVAKALVPLGPAAFIYTDIQRDGMQTGPNLSATSRLAQAVATPVIASGGVSTLKDIEQLLPLEDDGVIGVITGKALYAGTLSFQEALQVAGRTGNH
jgi:phosphoribosylformimino-5-aminoimidazole carboxamide ribotide isomerase